MKPVHILLLGDSITVGYPTKDGYRRELLAELAERWPSSSPPLYVSSSSSGPDAHEGHGGWTSQQLAARAAEWIDAAKPDVVVVIAGTNDPGHEPADIRATIVNLARITKAARDRGAAVVLATLPHASSRNEPIRQFARQIDRQAKLADLANAGVELSDSVHPNEQGYRTIAQTIAPLVRSRSATVKGIAAIVAGVAVPALLIKIFREVFT